MLFQVQVIQAGQEIYSMTLDNPDAASRTALYFTVKYDGRADCILSSNKDGLQQCWYFDNESEDWLEADSEQLAALAAEKDPIAATRTFFNNIGKVL